MKRLCNKNDLSERLTLRLTIEEYNYILDESNRLGISVSDLIRRFIDYYMINGGNTCENF